MLELNDYEASQQRERDEEMERRDAALYRAQVRADLADHYGDAVNDDY